MTEEVPELYLDNKRPNMFTEKEHGWGEEWVQFLEQRRKNSRRSVQSSCSRKSKIQFSNPVLM
jgi:hypothetical protein